MLTVSVVTFHTADDELRSALGCLQTPDVKRVWVVDNGREERIRKICSEFPNVEYIASDNVGYGKGHNKALRKAMELDLAPYHLVMNTDVEFDPAVLGRLSAKMDACQEIGCIQPKIVSPAGELQYNARRLPTPMDLITRILLPKNWFKRGRARYLLKNLDLDKPLNVPYHSGSFMFLRLDTLRETGLFDERFFLYPEDIDLTRRIHRDHITLYWPEVSIVHAHRAASKKVPRLFWIHSVNIIRYFNKWGWWNDPERRRFNDQIGKPFGPQ